MGGLKARVGQVVKPIVALSTPLLLKLIKGVEERLESSEAAREQTPVHVHFNIYHYFLLHLASRI